MLVKDKTEEEFAELAKEDLRAAIFSRQDLEARKLRVYQAYEVWSDKVTGGGKLSEADGGRGEFGWSKLEIPMLFWVVETELPRIALGAPTLVATAKNPKAVPYQRAKTMRLQCQMRDARVRPALFRSVKRMSLYGLGPMLWWWNADEGRVAVDDISWFDFFISPEARRWDDAEVLWVRSWFTPRQLDELAQKKDSSGAQLYRNLDDVKRASGDPNVVDPMRAKRREVHGQGPEQWTEDGAPLPLYTGYYKDGSIIMLGGVDHETLVQARVTPYWRRIPRHARRRFAKDTEVNGVLYKAGDVDPSAPTMRPMRPIVCLGNTPDTEGPYPTGSGEVVLTYQEEISTYRRQAMDQATAHLNAPIIYDKAALGENARAKIDAAFGAPGGALAVNAGSDVRSVVHRLAPGQMTMDVQGFTDMSRQEVQLVTGISDYVAGISQMSGLGSNTTATAVQRITDEANMRWRFKNALVEDDMQVAAMIVDNYDRLFGSTLYENLGDDREFEAPGTTDHGGGLVELDMAFNGDDYDYDVKVEAGSLTPPSQTQEFGDLMQLINTVMSVPEMAMKVNWDELIRDIVQVLGYEPSRVLLDEQQVMAKMAAASAQEGETPVGPPIPIGAG